MSVSVRLPDDLNNRLDFLARQTGRTKTYYILEALYAQIDELESYYLAADVLERLRKKKETAHAADEVRKDLGLED
ncbi:type II toxin-antitoxin system RelB family antitoxin [Desulfobacca acetoxidans]|uniref:CopG-like domain-containing protein DNA-binding protein n=1 Tax=Desulfobacca acetoxidans (strain ATCC 700848 / DSM 11109 / ASRB2) TaxID=880072 RepID=F2NJ02_DESAR|nr:ribbon-helix-helix protein, CopG family [Desulfobacca acetoxidans]AEB07960.1 CopG-like domain-containing protein DNA-binding protein [Desulfobacca acetoxidans DSM 11109]